MDYIRKMMELLQDIAEDMDTIRQAAAVVSDAFLQGHSVYVFGANHAAMLSEELLYRAGGLAIFNPIFGKELILDGTDILHSCRMQMLEGYGTLLAEKTNFQKGDVLLVHSVSGRNPSSIDLAMEAKRRGAVVIVILSLTYAKHVTSRSKSGKMLYEIGDIVIDNHGCVGDACIKVEGLAQKIAPTSTIAGCLIVNLLSIEVARLLVDKKIEPLPVFYSVNMDDGMKQNEKIFEAYKKQIHYM